MWFRPAVLRLCGLHACGNGYDEQAVRRLSCFFFFNDGFLRLLPTRTLSWLTTTVVDGPPFIIFIFIRGYLFTIFAAPASPGVYDDRAKGRGIAQPSH